MGKKLNLTDSERLEMTRDIEALMLRYQRASDPIWKAKARGKIRKIVVELDIKPFGYTGLPLYMRE